MFWAMGENIKHAVAKLYGHNPMSVQVNRICIGYAVSHRFYTVGIVLPTAVIFMYN